MTKVIRLVGQAVKTPPSHGGNRGSIPLRAVSINNKYGINRKHCEAKSLVRKQKCEKMQLSGVSYGRMAMRSHITCEAKTLVLEYK